MPIVRFLASVALSIAALVGATPAALAQQRAGGAPTAGSGWYAGLDYGTTRITAIDGSSGAGVRLGYDLTHQFAAEVSYASLDDHNGGRADAWALSGIGRLPLSHAFSVYARVGHAWVSQSEDSLSARTGIRLDNGWIGGLGATWAFLPQVGAYAEWVRYSRDADRWSLGLRYAF